MIKKQFQTQITIPENVTLQQKNNILYFQGPIGTTILNLNRLDTRGQGGIHYSPQDKSVSIITPSKSFKGLVDTLLQNKIQGVTRGFLVSLKLVGIGYRASLHADTLYLKCGYSHDIIYKIPSGVAIFGVEPTTISIFGVDKNQVTQIAAKLRSLRSPSVYKGKGIRLVTEKIALKAGKRK